MREPVRIDDGPCGCERYIIDTDVRNGDTIVCQHTDECRAASQPKPEKAPDEPRKVRKPRKAAVVDVSKPKKAPAKKKGA